MVEWLTLNPKCQELNPYQIKHKMQTVTEKATKKKRNGSILILKQQNSKNTNN